MGGECGDEVNGDVGVGIGAVVGRGEKWFGGGIGGVEGGDLVEGVVVCDEGGSGGGGGGEWAGWTVAIRRVSDRRRLRGEWLLLDLCKTEIQIVSSKFGRHFFLVCCVNLKWPMRGVHLFIWETQLYY